MKTIQLSERELSILLNMLTPPYRAEDIRSDEFNELRNKVFYALRDAQNDEPVSQPYKLPVGWVAVPVEPTEEMLNAWLSEVANWRGHEAGYRAMIAAAPHFREISNSSTKHFRENAETSTKCWCHTCRPVTNSDMRFVVCPDCGNKRCPHANDHRNACTGSNEPRQEGSAYPAAPQQEV